MIGHRKQAGPERIVEGRYRDVFAGREFRALFAVHLLSLAGDQVAKVAVAALVFADTGSAALAAAAFAIGYLPWVAGGPFLSALSDRLPRREVMVACDAGRAVLIGALALPGMPIAALIAVLFAASLLTPPFQAARAAILPEVLAGENYVVGQSLSALSTQLAQVIGFAGGGALVALLTVRGALVVDALSFAVSALCVAAFVADRRPARAPREARVRDGFRLVFGDRTLRGYLLLAWIGGTATAAPEGLMTAYAGRLGGGPATMGLLLAAMPAGAVAGAVLYGRCTPPDPRRRLIRPMALLSCAVLLPVLLDPPLPVVLGLLFAGGCCASYLVVLNALFMRAVPATHRARAHGVAAAGLMIGQGGGMAVAGALTDLTDDAALVTALCGLAGLAALIPLMPLTRPLLPTREENRHARLGLGLIRTPASGVPDKEGGLP